MVRVVFVGVVYLAGAALALAALVYFLGFISLVLRILGTILGG